MRKMRKPIPEKMTIRDAVPSVLFLLVLTGAGFVIPGVFSGDIALRLGREGSGAMGFEVGEIADRNVIANTRVTYLDTTASREAVERAVRAETPIFQYAHTETMDALIIFDELSRHILGENGLDSSAAFLEKIPVPRREDFIELLDSIGMQPAEQRLFLVRTAAVQLKQLLAQGVFVQSDLPAAGITGSEHDKLQIRWYPDAAIGSGELSIKNIVPTDMILLEDLGSIISRWTSSAENEQELLIRYAAGRLIEPFIFPNYRYDEIETLKIRRIVSQQVPPVMRTIERGEFILVKDFLVTEEAVEKLRILQNAQTHRNPLEILGSILFSFSAAAAFILLLIRFLPGNYRFSQYLYITLSMMVLYLAGAFVTAAALPVANFPVFAFFVPAAFFSMLLTVIISQKVGFLVSVYLTILALIMPSSGSLSFLFILAMGITGAVIMKNARKRIDIIKSFLFLIVSGWFFLALIGLIDDYSLESILHYALVVAANALISSILLAMLLPVFENIFNLPTDFRLLELTTMNTRILKRMAVVARGTYSHSVAVADLAESACEAIGANSLLARVGSYYHDIGKIDQPEYFIENQSGDNKHSELKPSLSAAIIKSHVKVGIEKAKEIGLPQEVIDILAEHHGSDLISYFFAEAVNKNDKNSKISPEDFSYSGNPPMSREAAVVMLADSVDAACRTLKQPTTPKIERMVWKIFMDKINNRQMVNSRLSLSELDEIRKQFVLILSGRYHTRIEYPDIPEAAKS